MKTTAVTATCFALASIAAANPIFGGKWNAWKDGKNGNDFKDIKDLTKPAFFTSTYHIVATPDQVINGTTPTPGEQGAIGSYDFGINTALDVICYVSTPSRSSSPGPRADLKQDIVLKGVTGDYQSAAKTATHVHAAAKGATGPPRLAFPNPLPISDDPKVTRYSKGCLKGPFTTGIVTNGVRYWCWLHGEADRGQSGGLLL